MDKFSILVLHLLLLFAYAVSQSGNLHSIVLQFAPLFTHLQENQGIVIPNKAHPPLPLGEKNKGNAQPMQLAIRTTTMSIVYLLRLCSPPPFRLKHFPRRP